MICVAHGPDYESNTSCAVEDTSRFHSSQFGFKGLVFIGFVECCLAGSPRDSGSGWNFGDPSRALEMTRKLPKLQSEGPPALNAIL